MSWPKFLEAIHLDEAGRRMPFEQVLDFIRLGPAARRTEIPDMRRTLLPQDVKDWRRRSTY